ncbi:hypothetical protein CCACVL1_11096, partial [Corchorus capsularis]
AKLRHKTHKEKQKMTEQNQGQQKAQDLTIKIEAFKQAVFFA